MVPSKFDPRRRLIHLSSVFTFCVFHCRPDREEEEEEEEEKLPQPDR